MHSQFLCFWVLVIDDIEQKHNTAEERILRNDQSLLQLSVDSPAAGSGAYFKNASTV